MLTILDVITNHEKEENEEGSLIYPSNYMMLLKDDAENEYYISTSKETAEVIKELMFTIKETQKVVA